MNRQVTGIFISPILVFLHEAKSLQLSAVFGLSMVFYKCSTPLLAGVLITLSLLSTLLFPLLQHHSFHMKAPLLTLIRLTYFLPISLTMTFSFESSLLCLNSSTHSYILHLSSLSRLHSKVGSPCLLTTGLYTIYSEWHCPISPLQIFLQMCMSNLLLNCGFIVLSPPTRIQILGRKG